MTSYLDQGPKNKRDRYEQLRSALWTERSTFDMHWRELGDFFVPRRTRFYPGDRNRGDKRNQNIIDSTGRFAARTLSSGLHAGLTSPARPWFKLSTPDEHLAEYKPVAIWLENVTRRMRAVFAGTNLYNSLPIVYGDLGVFGTAAMCVLEDDADLFRTQAFPIGSYALGLDRRGRASTFVREYELSVQMVVEEFGVRPGYKTIDWSRLSPAVKALWEAGSYTASVPCIWIVKPNEDADRERLGAQYLPFASCHFERDDTEGGRFLRESGYTTFPIMAPRWDITGEDSYGTDCPGMTALGDCKQLQLMQRKKAQAIAKMVDPPLVGPPELRTQKTSLLPGDITYLRGEGALKPIHEVHLDLSHLETDMGQTQYRIQRAFYEDLFLMLATSDQQRGNQPITAREVEERHEEKLLALGPVLERTGDELLGPIIDRVYALMEAAGLIPDAPDELDDVKLKVEYISIMAQAQKLVGVVAQDRFLQTILPIVQTDPSTRHKVDTNQLIDNYGEMLGVDPRVIRSNEEAQALVDEEKQAQQASQDAANAKAIGGALKDGAAAKMGQDTALDRVVGGAVAQVA